MGDILLPGGMRISEPDPAAQAIIQALAPLLQGIVNQLDMLIRLECSNVSRASLKKKLDELDAQVRARMDGEAANTQEQTEESQEKIASDDGTGEV